MYSLRCQGVMAEGTRNEVGCDPAGSPEGRRGIGDSSPRFRGTRKVGGGTGPEVGLPIRYGAWQDFPGWGTYSRAPPWVSLTLAFCRLILSTLPEFRRKWLPRGELFCLREFS
jgi:hypothetical protein